MNAQVDKFLQLPLLAAGVAATLVSGIAFAALALLANGAGSDAATAEAAPAPAPTAISEPAVSAYRCAECGVIVSTREIKVPEDKPASGAAGRMQADSHGGAVAEALPNYEITVRLQNGSVRVIRDAKPARWRHGEAVIVIAGAN